VSTLKVNGIRSNSASSDAITLANDGTCTANITNRSNRNLIINGAMQVAQRGTSSTTSGYNTVDRYKNTFSGTDEAPTFAQADVASGTTPYTLGFRKSLKVTNGNQTSGAGAGDYVIIMYKTEAQDLANSGWNYLSASSYITLSFWVKASVAQNYYFRLQTKDGGSTYNYPMETGSLSADTWTKITKTIPGNSNLQIDSDNGEGPKIEWSMFKGTDHTASSSTLNQWAGYADGTHTPDQTSTWYTTNDATFEITGVQLEVGSVATDFEHRSYAQELLLCQRYYQKLDYRCSTGSSGHRYMYRQNIPFIVVMRAAPSLDGSSAYNSDSGDAVTYTAADYSTTTTGLTLKEATTNQIAVTGGSGNQYHDIRCRAKLSAEL